MTAVPMSDCITRLADSGPRGSGRAFEASLEACMRETATGFRYRVGAPKRGNSDPSLCPTPMPQVILCLAPCRAAAGT
jgi:hypothetical protein